MTYQELSQYISKGRNKDIRPIGKHGKAIRHANGSLSIRLYSTDIVTLTEDGTIILNTNGYRTVTTKAWINEYAEGVYVAQKDYQWYVTFNGETEEFFDGIRFQTQ